MGNPLPRRSVGGPWKPLPSGSAIPETNRRLRLIDAEIITPTVTTAAVSFTADRTQFVIRCTAVLTITLPPAASSADLEYWVCNTSGGSVTLDGNAAELIDNATTLVVATKTSKRVVCDGTEWWSV